MHRHLPDLEIPAYFLIIAVIGISYWKSMKHKPWEENAKQPATQDDLLRRIKELERKPLPNNHPPPSTQESTLEGPR
jgi:hypothetical protein